MMPGIFARGTDEPVDKLLKLLKKQIERSGLMYDIKKREYYVKPSVAKVLKSRTARKRLKKNEKN
jgi:small subunit ribosomal protein S21